MGELRQRGRVWWIRYYRAGKRHEESARTTKRREPSGCQGLPEGTRRERPRVGRRPSNELSSPSLVGLPFPGAPGRLAFANAHGWRTLVSRLLTGGAMGCRLLVWACATLTFTASSSAWAGQQSARSINLETTAIVLRLLESTGYRYAKLADTSWRFNFKGDAKDEIAVWVAVNDEELALIAVIADADEAIGESGLRALLRENGKVEVGTILIDSDGDYVLHATYPLRSLETETFKLAVETAANTADDIYRMLKGPGNTTARSAARRETARRTVSAPREATQVIQLLGGRATLALDPRKWKETKSTETGRRTFEHISGEIYGIVITERITVPTESLRDIVLENLREGGGTDVKVLEDERRVVNGTEMLMLRTEARVQGIPLAYLGNYYGGDAGTVQVIAYTGQSLLREHRDAMEEFANGLRLVK